MALRVLSPHQQLKLAEKDYQKAWFCVYVAAHTCAYISIYDPIPMSIDACIGSTWDRAFFEMVHLSDYPGISIVPSPVDFASVSTVDSLMRSADLLW